MDYRRPILPWIIAALFLGAAVLCGALAQNGMGPGSGVGWSIASVIQAILGMGIIVWKLRHRARSR